MLPLESKWFDPGSIIVETVEQGEVPSISYNRNIKRDTIISYNTRIFDVKTNSVVCNSPSSGRNIFRMDAQLPENLDLAWWTDEECHELPAGTYRMTTCWTGYNLFYGLVPAKTVCREAEITILPKATTEE